MLPDRVSNPGPLTYESGALPIALRARHTSETTRLIQLNIICSLQAVGENKIYVSGSSHMTKMAAMSIYG